MSDRLILKLNDLEIPISPYYEFGYGIAESIIVNFYAYEDELTDEIIQELTLYSQSIGAMVHFESKRHIISQWCDIRCIRDGIFMDFKIMVTLKEPSIQWK